MFENILQIVSRDLPAAGIDCLLIGGFAVNHYGYTRNTLDIDFMMIADYAGRLRAIMKDHGLTNIDARNNVIFFSHPTYPAQQERIHHKERIEHKERRRPRTKCRISRRDGPNTMFNP